MTASAGARVHFRRFRGVIGILSRSAVAWFEHGAASMGASLAFYTLFSIAPILFIATWIAGTVLDADAVRSQILAQMQGLMGDAGAAAVRALITATARAGSPRLATAAGIVAVLIGATSVFGELQRALDRVWGTAVRASDSGLWLFLRTRILSFGLILGVGFLLLISLIVSAALAVLGTWLGSFMAEWKIFLFAIDLALSLTTATLLFAMIYKYIPREDIAWGDVWVGGLVTAVLFNIGKLVIGLYLSKSAFATAYGVAGSFLALLLWVYYSAQIFLFGAEFTHLFAYEYGSRLPHGAAPQPA